MSGNVEVVQHEHRTELIGLSPTPWQSRPSRHRWSANTRTVPFVLRSACENRNGGRLALATMQVPRTIDLRGQAQTLHLCGPARASPILSSGDGG